MSDTLLRLRLFAAVYEERSFTAAAERENATQSGVTQHVRKLEDAHGVSLFVRDGRTVRPTPAGDAYYGHCIEVLRAHERSRSAVREFKDTLSGEVVVGLTPTTTRGVLAPALARFVQSHPNVVVRVVDAYSDIVTDKLRTGEVDFGIVPGVKATTGIRVSRFARTPEFLVANRAAAHGLRHRRPVRLGALGPLKIVVPSRAQARRDVLEAYFLAVGARIERRLEIDTSLGALDFVARTDWVSVNPGISMLRTGPDAGLVVCPLVEPALMLDLYLIERARHPRSSEADAFLAVLEQETAKASAQAQRMMERGPSRARDQAR